MKHSILRTAFVALLAASSLSALSAAPQQEPHKPQSPIPICWSCGRGGVSLQK